MSANAKSDWQQEPSDRHNGPAQRDAVSTFGRLVPKQSRFMEDRLK